MEAIWQGAFVFAVALVATLFMVPVSKIIAHKIGAIDYPSNRRVNTEPIPRCGGIALYVGFFAGLAAFWIGVHRFGWHINDYYTLEVINYPILFLGVTGMFVVGLVDDVLQLRASTKFLWQIAAIVVVVLSGVSIGVVSSASGDMMLGVLDVPLTIIYLLIFVNITNLIDGLDGLAAGIVAISSLAFLFLVINRGSVTLSMVCVALFATCIGFLRYNFSPASVFMGDSGALFLGLIVGIISLLGVVRTQSAVIMMVPLTVAAVPVIDTSAAIVRRKLEHKPIGQPDMNHIHHRLLRSGLGQRGTVLVLYGATILSSIIAIAVVLLPNEIRNPVAVLLIIAGIALICLFGVAGPVLQHHYDNKGKRGPRMPHERKDDQYEKRLK